MKTPLLEIKDLTVRYPARRGGADAVVVDGVSLVIEKGTTTALVGESGCGKTALALSAIRLQEPALIDRGRVLLDGRDLTALTEREMCGVRGADIGMVFQEPAAALNPVMKVGAQVGESLRVHRGYTRRQAMQAAEQLLAEVAMPDPIRTARSYPHELSGGMLQRAMWAIALSCEPALIIADEPTTALDVTLQAQMLDLLEGLRSRRGLTMLVITHDVALVARLADRVGVMYAGRLVEQSPVADWLRASLHPYSRGLLRAVPGGPADLDADERRLPTLPGSVPNATDWPSGCRFHPRCGERFEPCDTEAPEWVERSGGRLVACHARQGEDA